MTSEIVVDRMTSVRMRPESSKRGSPPPTIRPTAEGSREILLAQSVSVARERA
jgi:hypothetical protein